jgi:hypothetical protein
VVEEDREPTTTKSPKKAMHDLHEEEEETDFDIDE